MKLDKLPIGSIVQIDKSLCMIIGYMPVYEGEQYDYSVCQYPFGMTTEKVYLIKNKDISKVIFLGYQDDGFRLFIKELSKNNTKEKVEKFTLERNS